MPEGPVEEKVSAARQPTPSAAIYPRYNPSALHSSRPSSSRAASASSRRTISRSGSIGRRARYRKDATRSSVADGGVTTDSVGIARRVSDSLDSDAVDIYNDYGWDTDLEVETARGGEEFDEFGLEGRNSSNGGPTLQIYLNACKKDGIIPASYFLRHVTDEHLSMKHHCLGPARIKPLCTALASSATVLSLDLEDNWLEERGGVTLCRMLKENCYITELDLTNNRLGATFARYFADVVLSNSTLTSVTLAGNLLDDAAAVHLAELIAGSGALEYLDLSRNKLGETAGVLLGPAISDNCSLKHLNLSFNSVRREGASALANGLKGNVLLTSIDLSWNGLAKKGAKALGDALRVNTTLEELNVTNNRLTADAAALISKGLLTNETLKTLKIGKNPLQSAGCQVICAALLKNPNSSIHRLDFTDISVSADVRRLISQLSERLPGLSVTTDVDPLAADSACTAPGRRGYQAGQPISRLRAYIEQAGLDPVNLFTSGRSQVGLTGPPRTVIDKDQFRDTVKSLEELELTDEDLDEIVETLTVKGRDLVDYSELIGAERPVSYYPSNNAATAAGTAALSASDPRPVSYSSSSSRPDSAAAEHRLSTVMSRQTGSRETESRGSRERNGRGSADLRSRSSGSRYSAGSPYHADDDDGDDDNEEYYEEIQ